MVAHFTMRVNQAFRFVEGIWLHRKSRQIRIYFRKRPILLYNMCATPYISTMAQTKNDSYRSGKNVSGSILFYSLALPYFLFVDFLPGRVGFLKLLWYLHAKS